MIWVRIWTLPGAGTFLAMELIKIMVQDFFFTSLAYCLLVSFYGGDSTKVFFYYISIYDYMKVSFLHLCIWGNR